jgi:hypothetical protein
MSQPVSRSLEPWHGRIASYFTSEPFIIIAGRSHRP